MKPSNRDQQIALLTDVIMGKAPIAILKPKSVLNLNLGRLNEGTPRFTLNGLAVTMAKAFEGVYSDKIDYQVTKTIK